MFSLFNFLYKKVRQKVLPLKNRLHFRKIFHPIPVNISSYFIVICNYLQLIFNCLMPMQVSMVILILDYIAALDTYWVENVSGGWNTKIYFLNIQFNFYEISKTYVRLSALIYQRYISCCCQKFIIFFLLQMIHNAKLLFYSL